jgi:signal transduction histidine kinase
MPPVLAAVMDTFCGGFTDPIVILDHNLQCIYSNEAAHGYMALVAGELVGQKLFEVMPDFDTAPAREELTRAATLRTPAKFEHYFSSQRVWLGCLVVPWRGGISIILTNVADYRRIDPQWKENARNVDVDDQTTLVRDLTFRLTQTEQRERRRLAQLLHDNLLQLLVAARMRMNALRATKSAAPLTESLLLVDSLLKDSIEMSRSVVLELSPPVLHESGLRSPLQWLSEHMKQRYGLNVDITFSTEMEPHEEERLLLFEATRELLFNVVKHSGAESASVCVSSEGSRLILSVEDSGKGFDSESFLRHSARSGVFGLFSIRQRVEMVGGQLEIANRSPQGTRITLSLPVRSD